MAPPQQPTCRPPLEQAHHTWMGWELGATRGTAWCDRQPQGLPGSAGSQNPSGLTASRGQWGPVGRKPECPGLCVLILRASLTALPTTPEQRALPCFFKCPESRVSLAHREVEINTRSPLQAASVSSKSLCVGSQCLGVQLSEGHGPAGTLHTGSALWELDLWACETLSPFMWVCLGSHVSGWA